jgi:alkylation response protein AidB-like acyl-CoA dehydrogenase
MDFNLNGDQELLADAVGRWLAADYDFEARRRIATSAEGFSVQAWQQLADLGLLGLNVPVEYGGLGAGAAETLIVMQAFGRALLVDPYVPTAVLAVEALVHGGTDRQKSDLLPQIVAGERRFALAMSEPDARYSIDAPATTATPMAAGGFRLTGRKSVVIGGGAAHELLTVARTGDGVESAGTAMGAPPLGLFRVDARSRGVTLRSFPTIDGHRAAEVTFEDVELPADAQLGAPEGGLELIARVTDRALATLCAEAVGAMERLTELTADHLRNRRQFGQPIGSFQALQHRLADMLIAVEQARSMALMAAAQVEAADSTVRRRALAAAKALIGQRGRFIGEQAVQLHGGMGMTDELAVSHYFKRLVCIDMYLGDSEHHIRRFGELS